MKLTKKFSGENRINNPRSKIFTCFDSNKPLKKDSKNSIVISTKPSTISSASSKNNSIISSKNVNIYLYFKILFILLFFSKKYPKKITLSSTQIIQKAQSFHSESRNSKNNLKQNNKVFNSSKLINGVTMEPRRKMSGFDLNPKETLIKYPLNKIQPTGGLRNSVSLGSNTTNMASPGVNINLSISKGVNSCKNNNNNNNLSNNNKNALL